MSRYSLLKLWVVGTATSLLICQTTVATPVTIFKDDFQTDTAGTGNVGTDLDPAIDTGAGDIGAWSNLEGSTGTNFPSGIQVYNDTVPANGIAGTNNFLRTYRGGSTTSAGHPYATGWGAANTTDRVVQLDMSVYQTSGTDPNLPSSNPPVYMHVMFGGAPRANPTQAAWLNTLSAIFGLSDAADSSTNSTATQPILDYPDDSWHTVRVIANYSLTTAQMGIDAQKYTVTIDGGTPTTGTFSTPQTTVQSILVGFGGANEQFHYIDDVQVQILNPLVPGDYNSNDSVDAADYVTWRSGIAPLANEVSGVTPGSTTDEDYDAWRARFGEPAPAGASARGLASAAVPEPASILLLALGASAWCTLVGIRRRRELI